jgi:hypothetical protein
MSDPETPPPPASNPIVPRRTMGPKKRRLRQRVTLSADHRVIVRPPDGSRKRKQLAARKSRAALKVEDPSELSPYHLKEGEIDPVTGAKIDYLISGYHTAIIYLDDDNSLHYRSTSEHVYPDEAELLAIESAYSDITHIARNQLQDPKEQRRVMVLLGGAIDAIFGNDNYEAAKRAIALARAKLYERSSQELRTTVIWSALIGAIVVTVAVVLMLQFNRTIADIEDHYLMAFAAGAVGAALSLLQRSSSFSVTRIATITDYVSECVARLFIGAVAGLIAAMGIAANVLFGFMTDALKEPGNAQGSNIALLILLALFAGISERFIPSFVKGIETQIDKEQKADKKAIRKETKEKAEEEATA